ncbi:MAG: hemerythrin family protein [Deltaproteobacteria bacterium]|nr:hemerythrin family protein [Deltaproteobacteria bacterium]
MALIWTPALLTGLDWQDNQHKDLFAKINEFIDAMNKGMAQDDLTGVFTFLGNYVRTHFKQEEAAMDKHSYPERTSHLALHKTFMDNIGVLQEGLKKQEDKQRLAIQARKLLADWFFEHVSKTDKKLGGFLVAHR